MQRQPRAGRRLPRRDQPLQHELPDLLPLAETWEPGTADLPPTTPEDAEQMIKDALPGERVEFVPAGLVEHVLLLRSFFRDKTDSDRLQFAPVHPNCESLTLVSASARGTSRLSRNR